MFNEPRKVMRLPQVMAVTGWSRSTVYDKIKAGKFPSLLSPTRTAESRDGLKTKSPNFSADHRAQCKGRVNCGLPGKREAGRR